MLSSEESRLDEDQVAGVLNNIEGLAEWGRIRDQGGDVPAWYPAGELTVRMRWCDWLRFVEIVRHWEEEARSARIERTRGESF